MALSFSKRDRLVEFLVRRSDGRPVLLPLIKNMIAEQGNLRPIGDTLVTVLSLV